MYFDYLKDCVNKKKRLYNCDIDKIVGISCIASEGKNAWRGPIILVTKTSNNFPMNILPLTAPSYLY